MDDWKDVMGFEGSYQISRLGRIRSLARKGSGLFNSRTKILTEKVDLNGYKVNLFFKNSKPKTMFIHKLLAIHFIPNPKGLPCVNHLNGIKDDNRLENLAWCSKSDDLKHAYRTGLRKTEKGVCLNTGRTHFKKGAIPWNKKTK